MGISNGGEQGGKKILVTFAAHDKRGLDRIFAALSETAHVDAVRQRSFAELRAVLFKQVSPMPNVAYVGSHFDQDEGIVFVTRDIAGSSDVEDYHIRDHIVPRALLEGQITPNPRNTLRTSSTHGDFAKPISPPLNPSGIFFLFMSYRNGESFIGDLEERYGVMLKEKGRRAATEWFWREVIRSLFSLTVQAVKRVAGFDKLAEMYRRIGS